LQPVAKKQCFARFIEEGELNFKTTHPFSCVCSRQQKNNDSLGLTKKVNLTSKLRIHFHVFAADSEKTMIRSV
jgi:hypothetical protein